MADTLSRLNSNPISQDVIEECTNLVDRGDLVESESYQVVTRSGNAKLKVPEINWEEDNNCESTKKRKDIPFLDYMPKLEDISWSLNTLKLEQQSDPFCMEICNNLRNKLVSTVQDLQSYVLMDGILYKHRNLHERDTKIINVVIPTKLLNKAINSVHFNNHCDLTHSLFKFKLKFYHPQERSVIRDFINRCEVCKILKSKLDVPVKIKNAPVATRPFESVSMDFIGPLIGTDSGNKYILSIICLFSRFTVLHAVPDKSTDTVISCLTSTFTKFGYPDTLLSDCALEFTSKAMKLYAKLNNIYKAEVLPYCPFSNGLVERHNSGINKLLKLYVNSCSHNNWDIFISLVENTLNNQYVLTLKETPAFVMFSRDTCPNIIRHSLDKMYDLPESELQVQFFARQNLLIQEQIRTIIINETNKRTQYHNTKRKDKILKVGDRVLIRNHLKRHKLDLSWLGPAVVIDVIKNKCIVKLGTRNIKTNVNYVFKLGI